MNDIPLRGYLLVTVAEASGCNKEEDDVWDPGFYEGYIRIEVRGAGLPTSKATSSIKRVLSGQISWQEDIVCEVLEGANELRVMLCKEKRNPNTGAIGQTVVAACGIYVEDILDAVPIDKYFELFKPKNGGDGGFIRVAMNFSRDPPEEAELEPSPYLPSTTFKSYSKEHAAAVANARNLDGIDSDDIPAESLADQTKDADDRIDATDSDDDANSAVDSNEANNSINSSNAYRNTDPQPTDRPEAKRRIPFGKVIVGAAMVVGLLLSQRRQ